MKKVLIISIAIFALSLSTSYALITIGVRGGFGQYGTSDKTITTGTTTTTIKGISESSFLFGGHIDITALPILGIEFSATYWPKSKSWDSTIATKRHSFKNTYSVISLEATGKYKISFPGSPITPYIGAGPGIYMSSSKKEVTPVLTGYPVDKSETKFGIHGAAGIDFGIPGTKLSFGAQGKYAYILSDPKSHLLSAVATVGFGF